MASGSANDALFSPAIAPVQLLALDEGATRVVRAQESGKRDELWQGEGFVPHDPEGRSFPLYVRLGEPGAMLAELLCTVIAKALGLPVAEPFLVLVEPGALPGSRRAPPNERSLAAATLDIGGATFAQLVRADGAGALALIRRWEHLVSVVALDEWLANPDRNQGNLLFVAQALHIIDHAEAFGGSMRSLFPLGELTHEQLPNKLADLLAADNIGQRQLALNRAREWLTFAAGGLDIPAAVDAANIRQWQTPQERAELVDFVSQRLSVTHSLLCSRLGHPQLALSR